MESKSADIKRVQLDKLKELFPEAVSEGKIDWEKLRLTLGEDITIDNERYVLNWAGKSDAFRAIQTPTTATLKPQPEQSVDFDKTENVFIEGENLEVLKVLQKSYYGKVKMIYIDPPYNTGNDSFIYPDKFSESKDEYLRRIGDKDEAGYLTKEGFFRKNSKENGQYHSNWLSMMYPRLFLARNLLRDDGVIFVSIDDNEVHNLRLMMNEIFGEENFMAQLIWEKGRKNDARFFSVGHEYMLVYAHSVAVLRARGTIWREPKPGAQEIWAKYLELRNAGKIDSEIEVELVRWFKSLPGKNPAKRLSRYKHVDKFGPWRDRDISWPGGGGPRYDVIHPETGKPCKVPERGWVFSDEEAMKRQIKLGLVVFRDDERDPPFRKAHLKPIQDELVEVAGFDESDMDDVESEEDVGLQVMPSVIYKQAQVAVKYLRKLFGAKIFDNPKDHEIIARIVKYSTQDGDLVLDFFGGSGTTAQAVMELNKEDGGNRKFILVQLPEKTDEDSEAYKAGYKTIADICRERIRRAIKSLTPNPSPDGEGDGTGDGVENLFKGASPTLFENAHRMRLVDKTEAEDRLWQALRNRKVENCKFRRQHPIGNFILDFYCHERKLAVEIDGGYHNEEEQKEHDAARTQVINEFGIRVIRFSNEEVLKEMETTVEKISEALKGSPTDSPLSERRGAGGEAGFKAFTLQPSNFKVWRTDTIENGDDLVKQMDAFADPVRAGTDAEAMAWEILVKSGYELTTKMEALTLDPSPKGRGKDGGVPVFSIAGGEVILALERISQEAIDEIVKMKPKNFICLDRLFAGNDQLKTNTALQLKDAGVEFKTV